MIQSVICAQAAFSLKLRVMFGTHERSSINYKLQQETIDSMKVDIVLIIAYSIKRSVFKMSIFIRIVLSHNMIASHIAFGTTLHSPLPGKPYT